MTSNKSSTNESNASNSTAFALGNLANCPIGQLSLLVNWRNHASFVASPPQPWAYFGELQASSSPAVTQAESVTESQPEPIPEVVAEIPPREVSEKLAEVVVEPPAEQNQSAIVESKASEASVQSVPVAVTEQEQPAPTAHVETSAPQAATEPIKKSQSDPKPQPQVQPEPVASPSPPISSAGSKSSEVEAIKPIENQKSVEKIRQDIPKPEPTKQTAASSEQNDAPKLESKKSVDPKPAKSAPSNQSKEPIRKFEPVSKSPSTAPDFETMNAFASFGTPLSTDDYVQQLEGLVLELNCELERLQLKESTAEVPATSLIFRRMINLSLQNRELKQQLKKQST